jgi:hypothetical protein
MTDGSAETKRKSGVEPRRLYVVDGMPPRSIRELAVAYQIAETVLRTRLGYGWDIEHALARPARRNRKVGDLTVDGKTMTFKEWSVVTGIAESILRNRVWLGWDPAEVVSKPVRFRPKRKAN